MLKALQTGFNNGVVFLLIQPNATQSTWSMVTVRIDIKSVKFLTRYLLHVLVLWPDFYYTCITTFICSPVYNLIFKIKYNICERVEVYTGIIMLVKVHSKILFKSSSSELWIWTYSPFPHQPIYIELLKVIIQHDIIYNN